MWLKLKIWVKLFVACFCCCVSFALFSTHFYLCFPVFVFAYTFFFFFIDNLTWFFLFGFLCAVCFICYSMRALLANAYYIIINKLRSCWNIVYWIIYDKWFCYIYLIWLQIESNCANILKSGQLWGTQALRKLNQFVFI